MLVKGAKGGRWPLDKKQILSKALQTSAFYNPLGSGIVVHFETQISISFINLISHKSRLYEREYDFFIILIVICIARSKTNYN